MKYRYHWSFKLLAFTLAVVAGVVLWLGSVGLILGELGYYERSRRSQRNSDVTGFCRQAAEAVFDRYAWQDTGIEPKLFERFFRWNADVDAADRLEYDFFYAIRTPNGELLESNLPGTGADWEWSWSDVYDVRRGSVTVMPMAEYYPTYREMQAGTFSDLDNVPLPPLGEKVTSIEYYVVSDDGSVNWKNVSCDAYYHADAGGADYTIYRMEYTGYDTCRVDIYLNAEQVAQILGGADIGQEYMPQKLVEYKESFGPMAIWGGLVLLVAMLWLALTAGRSPKLEEVRPGGLNRIPLDFYLAGLLFAGFFAAVLTVQILDQMVWHSGWGVYDSVDNLQIYWDTAAVALVGGGAGLAVTMFTTACAAQMKAGDGFWLKNTLIGICWRWGGTILVTSVKGLWRVLRGSVRWVRSALRSFAAWLPLTWQWLIVSGGLWLVMILCCMIGTWNWSPALILLGALVTAGIVCYAAWCFGALRNAAKKMSEGNLEEKIEQKYLLGCFGEFAGHLNVLGDVCVDAAKQQMKSERMKTELITNVSHDIKTPLTSIINYVDLLQKTEDEQERRQYLEVLDRQSQRLKKLIEDLMEMSRAASGNVAVEITATDVREALNQALGEFSDTLSACGLSVVTQMPDGPVMALCDGKHLWRVLSNCLGNVVKYAMSGTRVYVDLAQRDRKTEISIKNISAGMLNISAEELMERFVRGDESRNTEGNGLGLNIAKSLMELQGGKLELLVDGDLFKVVLTLNAA